VKENVGGYTVKPVHQNQE